VDKENLSSWFHKGIRRSLGTRDEKVGGGIRQLT